MSQTCSSTHSTYPTGSSRRLGSATPGKTTHMIGFLVAGLVIGLLARLILPGRQRIGLLWTLGLGVVGSLIGGTIANALGSGDIWELNFIGFVAAVAASVVVLAVAERAGIGRGDDRDRARLTGPGRA